jgi:anti-sigma B factor antagonist
MSDSQQAKLEHGISSQGEVTVLAIKGRMDAARVGAIRETLAGMPGQGHLKIVIDLSELEWIDSSGVGALVMLYKNAKARGGEVTVASLQRQPREIFRLLHLDSAFAIFETVPEAVARLGGSPSA